RRASRTGAFAVKTCGSFPRTVSGLSRMRICYSACPVSSKHLSWRTGGVSRSLTLRVGPFQAPDSESQATTLGSPAETGLPLNHTSRYRRAAGGMVWREAPDDLSQRRGTVYVACSTLCFNSHSFEDALRIIAELEFNKID